MVVFLSSFRLTALFLGCYGLLRFFFLGEAANFYASPSTCDNPLTPPLGTALFLFIGCGCVALFLPFLRVVVPQVRGEIRTTVDYLVQLLETEAFKTNKIDTAWLDGIIREKSVSTELDPHVTVACAAIYRAFVQATVSGRVATNHGDDAKQAKKKNARARRLHFFFAVSLGFMP